MFITACIILIGDEILSGRTQDKNVQYIAKNLTTIGVRLSEVRVIPDNMEVIISTINHLRSQYSYVFTTGGIGATHDDITTDAVARAFEREVIIDSQAYEILKHYYENKQTEFSLTRQRMARIPKGAKLIYNTATAAPGYFIDNVYVMAGIPSIMQAMFDTVLPQLKKGPIIHSQTILTNKGEGEIAEMLGNYQKKFSTISIGSYPFYKENGTFGVNIVLRSENKTILGIAKKEIQEYLATL